MVSVRFREIPDVTVECSISEAVELIRLLVNIDVPKVMYTPTTWKEYILSLKPMLPSVFSSNDVHNIAKDNLPSNLTYNSSSIVRTLREFVDDNILKRHGSRKFYKYTWQ